MPIHIYHPTKSVKGFACSFWYSIRENCVFATIVKQAGWDEKSGNGTFKASLEDPNKHVNKKFSEIEVGSMLECLEKNRPYKAYHEHEQKPKSIALVPWMGAEQKDFDGKVTKLAEQQGFSFSITVTDKQDTTTKNSFYIGLNFGEGRVIAEFLKHTLHIFFTAQGVNTANKTPVISSKVIEF